MKLLWWIGFVACSLSSVPVVAQSDFDGAWRVDLAKSDVPTKPEAFLLQNGMYQCKAFNPVIDVKADGEDHCVASSPYSDAISVTVVDDQTIETIKKIGGKTVATYKVMIAPDGNTARFEFNDSTDTNADTVTGKGTMTRVAKRKRSKAGSNAISGSWQVSKIESLSDNALLFTLKV